jgi:hypothetical protein
MSDRELLQLAAKAGGVVGEYECWAGQGFVEGIRQILNGSKCHRLWNPLTDDGDALRLAVRREIEVRNFNGKSHAGRQGHFWCTEDWFPDGDQYAATRRAIVRAAAKDEGEAG